MVERVIKKRQMIAKNFFILYCFRLFNDAKITIKTSNPNVTVEIILFRLLRVFYSQSGGYQ